jgi:hypothetical protein
VVAALPLARRGTGAPRIGAPDVARGLRLLRAVPSLSRRPITAAAARAVLGQRLAAREAHLLALVRRATPPGRSSPYARLLAAAGCEYGDVARLVAREGVEGTLARLAGSGVYLTAAEAKGRCPVVRGSTTFTVEPAALASAGPGARVSYATSGSRGAPTVVSAAVEHFRDRAVNTRLCLAARDGVAWRHGLWVVPGGAALVVLLQHVALGIAPDAWFTQLDPRDPGLDPRYAWMARVLRWGARVAGVRLPAPIPVPPRRPEAVLGWMRRALGAGRVPHLVTFPSSAVALCRAARAAGIPLDGAQASIGGEPVTAARLATIRAAGVEAVPHYGTIEAGRIGEGCLRPVAADDLHLFHDLHAVVQAGPAGVPGLPPDALLVSSLCPSSPAVLLNASLGDRGVLESRGCGCPLEALGWTTHLHSIRSHETLTAAGMTLPDAEAAVALEEGLPARFGGGPGDYQLLEEEDADGQPRLVLLVAPRVGPLDPDVLAKAFLDCLASAGRTGLAPLVWRDAGLLRVERRPPLTGSTGKVLHRHAAAGSSRAPRG